MVPCSLAREHTLVHCARARRFISRTPAARRASGGILRTPLYSVQLCVVKKIFPLMSLAALALLPLLACANGEADATTTDDVSFTSAAEAGPDSSVRLPPRGGDDAATAPHDAGTTGDGAAPGDAAADSSVDATTDAKPAVDAAVTGACPSGYTQLGAYATWYGKVNVHRATGGTWLVDTDCTSGADVNTVAYCKKFWPASIMQVQLAAVSPDPKPFTSGGGSAPACGGLALSAGQLEMACCAP